MKTNKTISQLSRLVLVGVTAVTVGACASSGSLLRQGASPLPIEARGSSTGSISTTRAHETSDRLYVSGTMKKSFGISPAAHVDVRLIDSSGRVIAEKQDDIDPGHPSLSRGRSGRYSYVVSFPISEARQAAKIVVQYEQSHTAEHQAN